MQIHSGPVPAASLVEQTQKLYEALNQEPSPPHATYELPTAN
jgi:hypothetical protein